MKFPRTNFKAAALFSLFLQCFFLTAWGLEALTNESDLSKGGKKEGLLRVSVVGDTGIGERAFHPGFVAVQKALVQSHPDVLLHLGDFIYQPEWFPETCRPDYIREVRETLVEPFRFRLFVPGDNDFPPYAGKPKASGCWGAIDPLDSPFDPFSQSGPQPGPFEGTRVIGNTFFAILNSYPWKDPTAWLGSRIEEARRKGQWIIISVHEPAVTTAWFLDKRDTVLQQLNALRPDLVFSGNQHSYERFHPMGIVEKGGSFQVMKSGSGKYRRGDGTIHVISGGGGATFKPFADQQKIKKRIAPQEVFDALAVRALMNHFLVLEISQESLQARTYRVCPDPGEKEDPRWKPGKEMWKTITLECDGQPAGVSIFDEFEIRR